MRRWLSELAASGAIQKTGIKKGTRYQSVSPESLPENPLEKFPEKYSEKSSEESASEAFTVEESKDDFSQFLSPYALRVLALVRQPIYARSPVTYNDDWIDSYQPNRTFYLSAENRASLASLGASNMRGGASRHLCQKNIQSSANRSVI